MCMRCLDEDQDYLGIDHYEEDITTAQAVAFLVIMSPVIAYIFLRDAVLGGARRRARRERTKITREQKRIFKDWSNR